MKAIIAAVILANLCAAALASGINGGWCGEPGNEPTEEGQGMAIDDTGIAFIDTVCKTTSRERRGDAVVLQAECSYADDDEAGSWDWSATLSLKGQKLVVTMDDGATATFSRCDAY